MPLCIVDPANRAVHDALLAVQDTALDSPAVSMVFVSRAAAAASLPWHQNSFPCNASRGLLFFLLPSRRVCSGTVSVSLQVSW
jgi:hypothetical protein